SANLDRETWLKVSRSAPRDELAKALEEKMERYHALLEAVGDDEGLRTDIELILGRASSMLRLARQPVPGAAPPPGKAAEPLPSVESAAPAPSAPSAEPAVAEPVRAPRSSPAKAPPSEPA